MIVNASLHKATHQTKDGTVHCFTPEGPLYIVDDKGGLHLTGEDSAIVRAKKNPIERIPRGGLSARLFIGLNVGSKPTYTVKQIIDETVKIRKRQKALPNASFLSQKGVYTHAKSGKIVRENSVQIILIDTVGTPIMQFEDEVKELGTELRARFKQESVILEIQKGGVLRDSYDITADKKPTKK